MHHVTHTLIVGIAVCYRPSCGKESMFDLRKNSSSDHHGHPQSASSRPVHASVDSPMATRIGVGGIPLVAKACGNDLLDGIRNGIATHGWTLPALAHRTELPMPMLDLIMNWKPGLPAADAVWWSLELDSLAAAHGRRFRCIDGRSSSIRLGQIVLRMLRWSGRTWAEFTRKASGPNLGGLQPAGTGGWGGEDPLGVLDRMAVAGGVTPVLLSA
jgi:hypothetical protein